MGGHLCLLQEIKVGRGILVFRASLARFLQVLTPLAKGHSSGKGTLSTGYHLWVSMTIAGW
jgi:hypothetical protein